MKSWRTTIGGALLAIGSIMVQVSAPEWVSTLGGACVSVGGLIMGVHARDNKVTSKEAGAE